MKENARSRHKSEKSEIEEKIDFFESERLINKFIKNNFKREKYLLF